MQAVEKCNKLTYSKNEEGVYVPSSARLTTSLLAPLRLIFHFSCPSSFQRFQGTREEPCKYAKYTEGKSRR